MNWSLREGSPALCRRPSREAISSVDTILPGRHQEDPGANRAATNAPPGTSLTSRMSFLATHGVDESSRPPRRRNRKQFMAYEDKELWIFPRFRGDPAPRAVRPLYLM